MKKTNPFSIFQDTEKTAFIKSLNAEIRYRELSMAEADAFNKRFIKDYRVGDDTPNVDMTEVTKIAYEKIAICMIEPEMTVEELKNLGASASKAIQEIGKLIDGREDEDDKEGNPES